MSKTDYVNHRAVARQGHPILVEYSDFLDGQALGLPGVAPIEVGDEVQIIEVRQWLRKRRLYATKALRGTPSGPYNDFGTNTHARGTIMAVNPLPYGQQAVERTHLVCVRVTETYWIEG